MTIEQLYKSKKVNNYLYKICGSRLHLKNDLLHYCILELLEKDLEILNEKLKKENKTLEDYFIGICVNSIKSNTSNFFKQYINSGFNKNISIKENDSELNLIDDNIDIKDKLYEESKEDLLLIKIDKCLLGLNPIDVEIFRRKYYDNMTDSEISEYYNIKLSTIRMKIFRIKKDLKIRLLNGNNSNKNIEWNKLREKQGKPSITNDTINDIRVEFKMGESKINLSKKYKLSYPFILKIINKNV